jgi:predicted DNA-binding transcriptional regulator YafY
LKANRKKETITLSIPPGTKDRLEAIARRFNIFWGKSPSPSGLIAAIAEGEIEIGEPFTLSAKRVEAIEEAIDRLLRSGHIEKAQTLSNLLLERGKLSPQERREISERVSQYDRDWRLTVDRYIRDRQPFRVMYVNSQGQELEFTVRCAEIMFREKEFYLEVWCEETEDLSEEDRQDFPELVHNRCLKFSRIQSLMPIEERWRDSLDFMEVQLQLTGDLVRAYEGKTRDIDDRYVNGKRIITRKVSSPFWLIREILPYGTRCVVLTPNPLRERMKQMLLNICRQYDSE